MKIQDIQINQFPIIIFADTHTNLVNIKKLRDLYPKSQFICLGDFTSLWDQKRDLNKNSIQYFIDNNISTVFGNHEDFILAVEKGNRQIINYVTNKNLEKYNLEKHHIDFLNNLPTGFKLNLPNGKHYLCFHNLPDDLWSFTDDINQIEFYKKYPINDKTIAVFTGHLHKNIHQKFVNCSRISVGALKYKDYLLINEDSFEFKRL